MVLISDTRDKDSVWAEIVIETYVAAQKFIFKSS